MQMNSPLCGDGKWHKILMVRQSSDTPASGVRSARGVDHDRPLHTRQGRHSHGETDLEDEELEGDAKVDLALGHHALLLVHEGQNEWQHRNEDLQHQTCPTTSKRDLGFRNHELGFSTAREILKTKPAPPHQFSFALASAPKAAWHQPSAAAATSWWCRLLHVSCRCSRMLCVGQGHHHRARGIKLSLHRGKR